MLRKFIIAWLSLVLVSAQCQLVAHAFSHVGSRVAQGTDVVVHNVHDAPCLECSLLPASSNVVPGDRQDHALDVPVAGPAPDVLASAARARFAPPYLSRAPPASA